jgi:hypothetical protein
MTLTPIQHATLATLAHLGGWHTATEVAAAMGRTHHCGLGELMRGLSRRNPPLVERDPTHERAWIKRHTRKLATGDSKTITYHKNIRLSRYRTTPAGTHALTSERIAEAAPRGKSTSEYSRVRLADDECTPTQLAILAVLGKSPGMRLSAISRHIRKNTDTTLAHLGVLEDGKRTKCQDSLWWLFGAAVRAEQPRKSRAHYELSWPILPDQWRDR